MQINDIIKSDKDRLFIVDHECYIIFTGDATTDEKPFIRIGNWIDLPAELIPMIENIIITDDFTGNPAHEQFNIDVHTLSSNRFIGSREIAGRFLNYQKNFNLDLRNASIVDIESDIPDISKEKNLSEKNQYIGVFYRNGNFKVTHGGKTIMDLSDVKGHTFDISRILSSISAAGAGAGRYNGSGLVLLGNCPVYYSSGNYFAEGLPEKYLEAFSILSMDPEKIREAIYRSNGLSGLAPFLKWKASVKSGIKIYASDTDIVDSIKKLFSSASISSSKIQGLESRGIQGFRMASLAKRENYRVEFKSTRPDSRDLSLILIRDTDGLKELIKEKSDAIMLDYTAYESSAIALRHTGRPIIIFNDGNKNISKIKTGSHIIVQRGIQYELESHTDISTILSLYDFDENLVSVLFKEETEKLEEMIKSLHRTGAENRHIRMFNAASLIKIFLDRTTNRKFSSRLKAGLNEIYSFVSEKELYRHRPDMKIFLVFHNSSLYQLISAERQKTSAIYHDEILPLEKISGESPAGLAEFYSKVINDRMRLRMLINIFLDKHGSASGLANSAASLKKAIDERKSAFFSRAGSLTETKPVKIMKGISAKGGLGKWPLWIAIFFMLAALAAALIYFANRTGPDTRSVTEQKSRVASDKEIADLIQKYGISIDDTDIYRYANTIALKNGYSAISLSNLSKEKNPDWIYPGNALSLHDDERITVASGDTLWAISRKKLIESEINFNKALQEVKEASALTRKTKIEEAKKLCVTSKCEKILDELSKPEPANNDGR